MRLNDNILVPEGFIAWSEKSSVLWFLGSHTVDLVTWIINNRVKRVFAVSHNGFLKSRGCNCVDTYLSTLEFENGAVAQLENGWVTPNTNPSINDIKFTLLCTKGMVNMDASSHNFYQMFTEEKVENPDFLIRPKIHDALLGYATESIRSFIRSLYFDRDFVVDFDHSVDVNRVLFAIQRSTQSKSPETIVY